MTGILPMAVLTLLGATVLCVATLNHLTKSDRRFYWLLVAGLPLSLVVNRWVKIPLVTAIASQADIPLKLGLDTPLWFIVMILFNAPVFEEAIKALPIALPFTRAFLRDASRSQWAGLALGMGFGLGEAAYLAYGISQSSDFQHIPWHMFTGFAVERLVVTFAHGFLTSIAVYAFYRGGRNALFGYGTAVGLHALINLGPILLALKLVPEAASTLTNYLSILGAFAIFQKNLRAARNKDGSTQEEIVYFER